MRLLRIDSEGDLTLREFYGDKVPPYAILSHTWSSEGDEVCFQDITEKSYQDKIGYMKIKFCGWQARKDGLDHFWVDTCCIDKSNFTELSEAIISMVSWYKKAMVCYVFLTDVSARIDNEADAFKMEHIDSIRKSRWFTRSWTLQELIAPIMVKFFSREVCYIGDRAGNIEVIHDITGISDSALQRVPMAHFTIQERFSWASERDSRKPEDRAYSLMGIFDVQMPIVYGEGAEKALRRLKDEIARDMRRALDEPVSRHTGYVVDNAHMELQTGFDAVTDSGYGGSGGTIILGLDKQQSPWISTEQEHLTEPDHDVAETLFSETESLQVPKWVQYAVYFADELQKLLPSTFDASCFEELEPQLDELLKSFAVRLKSEGSTNEHGYLMYLVRRFYRIIHNNLRQRLFDDEDPIETVRLSLTNDGEMTIEEKMQLFDKSSIDTHRGQEDEFDGVPDDDFPLETVLPPDLEVYQNLIRQSPAFEWLMNKISNTNRLRLSGSNNVGQQIKSCISAKLSSRNIVSRHRIQYVTTRYDLNWNLLDFYVEQEYDFPLRDVFERAITITGYKNEVQLMSCVQYMTQTWGEAGIRLIHGLRKAIFRSQNEGDSSDDAIASQSKWPAGLSITMSYEGGVFDILVTGVPDSVAEIGAMLAWLASALRQSPSEQQAASCLAIAVFETDPRSHSLKAAEEPFSKPHRTSEADSWRKVRRSFEKPNEVPKHINKRKTKPISSIRSHMLSQEQFHGPQDDDKVSGFNLYKGDPRMSGKSQILVDAFYLICRFEYRWNPIADSSLHDLRGLCWLNVLRNPAVVDGFPILRREKEGSGLELSLDMMARLTNARYLVDFSRMTVLKGFSTMLVATEVSDTTVHWHLFFDPDKQYISYRDAVITENEEIDEMGLIDHNILSSHRHILGWCKRASRFAGTRDADYNIGWSNLRKPNSAVAFQNISISAGKFLSIGTTLSLGLKDKSPHVDFSDDYISTLLAMSQKYFVFYDTLNRNACLLDGVSALLHLLRASLSHLKQDPLTEDLIEFNESDLQEAKIGREGMNAAFDVLRNEKNQWLPLWPNAMTHIEERVMALGEKVVDTLKRQTSYFCFRDRVMQLCRILQQITTHYDDTRNRDGVGGRIKASPRRQLEGFDFMDVATQQGTIWPKCTSISAWSEGWVDFTRALSCPTLFGSDFGPLIQAEGNACQRCMSNVPPKADLLAITTQDLKDIIRRRGDNKCRPWRIVEDIHWNVPEKLFEPCDCDAHPTTKHDRVQLFLPSSYPKLWGTGSQDPVLVDGGAVLVGHSFKFPLRWENKKTPEKGDPHIPADEEDQAFQDSGIGSSRSPDSGSASVSTNQMRPTRLHWTQSGIASVDSAVYLHSNAQLALPERDLSHCAEQDDDSDARRSSHGADDHPRLHSKLKETDTVLQTQLHGTMVQSTNAISCDRTRVTARSEDDPIIASSSLGKRRRQGNHEGGDLRGAFQRDET